MLFQLAFLRDLENLISPCTAIIEYDNKLCERVKELLSNSVASLELDGGKDVNSRKLIGLGVLKDGRCLCWDLLDTDGDTLDTGYYDTVITDAVLKMEKDGLFIASLDGTKRTKR